MDTPTPPIPVDLGRIAQDLQIRRVQVESVVQLLDEGNTVPFITRYRKERTGNLNEMAIREVQVRVGRLRELAERKETILKTIEAQAKLTDELAAAIRQADNPKRLEDLYLPYKPKKRTKASEAREKGLEPLALRVWDRDEALTDLNAAAAEFVNVEKELDTPEKVLEGVGFILSELINELAPVRDAVRRVVWKTGKIGTTKAENLPEAQGLEYRDYFSYSEPVGHIPPHRVLAINRGDKEGPLKVKLEVSRPEVERAILSQLPLEAHPQGEFFHKAAIDALDRLLMPSLEREVRRDLTEMAERHAVEVFARNLRSLLLQPPIHEQTVLALDPGFRTGCKVAVLDPHGNLLEHGVIHPHQPQNRRHESKVYLKDLVGKYKVGVVAIGNGTACRETEELIAEIIAEGTKFHQEGQLPPAPASTEGHEAAAPAPQAQAAHEDQPPAEAPAPEPAAAVETPIETAPEPVALEAHHHEPGHEHGAAEENGSAEGSGAESHEPAVDAIPPVSGGAPEDEPAADAAAPSPEESGTPPPSSAPEAESSEAESQKADQLEKSDESRNPAHEGGPHASAEAPPAEAAVAAPEGAPGEGNGVPAATDGTTEAAGESHAAAEPAPAEGHGEAPAAEGAAGPKPEAAPGHDRGPRPPRPKGEPRPPRPRTPPPPPAPHAADAVLAQLAYVIVNEAGASVYSASPVGRDEFPDLDATTRGTVSIGRRLQDPLSELVKIEPQNIGVGLYQHDVNPKHLKESLEGVIESCVNYVGVDLNTASVPLLRHVSGLNQLTARRVVEFRKEKGPFTTREQIQEIEGVGPATFTQAAGFLKIGGGPNPLDRTWVHPESYPVAEKLLERLEFTPDVIRHRDQLPALHAKLNEADIPALAQELGVGEPTLHDICEALARPERDPREDLPKPIFKKGVLKLEDLAAGMELKGTVLNVVDFGAFVDIGLKDSGLVHISQLANRYIKSPHDVVSVGDVVSVWVMGVDQERKRVSLTMVEPGTERPRSERGPQQGGGRRGEPRGGAPGGGDRGPQQQFAERRPPGPPRGPRREDAPQGPQPVGAGSPSGGEGGPPSQQRPGGDRDRGGPGRSGPGGGRFTGGPQRGGPGGSFGRGGPRPGGPGGGQGRFERAQAPRPPMPPRPNKPAPPPPPLSKDALTGSVPLRSFGQLKQLWQARDDEPGENEGAGPAADASSANPAPPPTNQGPAQEEPSSDPQPESDQSSN